LAGLADFVEAEVPAVPDELVGLERAVGLGGVD
jgi:hypothetical protein